MTLYGSLMHISDDISLFDINLMRSHKKASKGSPKRGSGRGIAVPSLPVLHSMLPDGNVCTNFGSDIPSGMLLPVAQATLTFNDGSMIWGDAAPDGYVCFHPGFAYAPYIIKGGYGRFEGAEGWVTFEIDTHRFGDPSLVTPETGIATGEIVLP